MLASFFADQNSNDCSDVEDVDDGVVGPEKILFEAVEEFVEAAERDGTVLNSEASDEDDEVFDRASKG